MHTLEESIDCLKSGDIRGLELAGAPLPGESSVGGVQSTTLAEDIMQSAFLF